jgi:hypothetical protein
MYVEMRHALADTVVNGDKGTIGGEGVLGRAAKPLCVGEQRPKRRRREIGQGLEMHSGDEQHVAGEERLVIEEGQRGFILENHWRGDPAGGDLAEGTLIRHSPIMPDGTLSGMGAPAGRPSAEIPRHVPIGRGPAVNPYPARPGRVLS